MSSSEVPDLPVGKIPVIMQRCHIITVKNHFSMNNGNTHRFTLQIHDYFVINEFVVLSFQNSNFYSKYCGACI